MTLRDLESVGVKFSASAESDSCVWVDIDEYEDLAVLASSPMGSSDPFDATIETVIVEEVPEHRRQWRTSSMHGGNGVTLGDSLQLATQLHGALVVYDDEPGQGVIGVAAPEDGNAIAFLFHGDRIALIGYGRVSPGLDGPAVTGVGGEPCA